MEESIITVSEETTTAENTSEAYTESQTVTTAEETSISADSEATMSAPDKAFLLDLCTKWLDKGVLENGKSFALGGSPVGMVTALYTDIDGDLTAEFCFIVDAYGSSALYVCSYINEAWEVTDILTIAKQYTYLQKTDNGATSLFAVVGSRAAEGLTSYVYNNGVEESFEMFNYTAFYDNELTAAENADDVYYKAIEDTISKYDNLTYLFDFGVQYRRVTWTAKGFKEHGNSIYFLPERRTESSTSGLREALKRKRFLLKRPYLA